MNNRMLRVSELMRREIGQDLQREFDFTGLLVSVHEVQVAPDLKSAVVYVGVIGPSGSGGQVIEKLNAERGAIQNRIARRVVLKYTPKLEFRFDDSVKRGVDVIDLLDQIDIPDDDSEGGNGETAPGKHSSATDENAAD